MAIGATADYINKVKIGVIDQAKISPENRVTRRLISKPAPTDVAQISPQAINPQPLVLTPERPEHNESAATFQQCGSIAQVIFSLASAAGLKDIAAAAKALHQENQALG